MHKTSLLVAAALAGLTACGPVTPVVAEYNGDSVTIMPAGLGTVEEMQTAAQKEADRICGKNGKRAEYASTRTLPDYTQRLLYLCL